MLDGGHEAATIQVCILLRFLRVLNRLVMFRCRYNRDLNSASRPPIRLITTHDSPPTCPMVLCVSNILWPEGTSVDDTDASPELEVTDGWYKMRAQLDNCLMKAVKKGRIRIGAKLATVGARVSGSTELYCLPSLTNLIVFIAGQQRPGRAT